MEFVEAKWYTKVLDGEDRGIWYIGIHDMEAFENLDTAEKCARYFQVTDRKVSSHLASDANSTVCCVQDKDVAYCIVDGNRHGLHIEMAGFASQTGADWHDDYSQKMLKEQVAPNVAAWCKKHNIPAVFLTADAIIAAVRSGVPYRGITTHAEHNKAMKVLHPDKAGSYSHWDPGPNFPMDEFLGMVNAILNPAPIPPEPTPIPPTPTPTPEVVLKDMPRVQLGSTGTAVLDLQCMLILRGYMTDKPANKDGVFGSGTDSVVRKYQQDKGLVVDGKVWEQTWARLGRV